MFVLLFSFVFCLFLGGVFVLVGRGDVGGGGANCFTKCLCECFCFIDKFLAENESYLTLCGVTVFTRCVVMRITVFTSCAAMGIIHYFCLVCLGNCPCSSSISKCPCIFLLLCCQKRTGPTPFLSSRQRGYKYPGQQSFRQGSRRDQKIERSQKREVELDPQLSPEEIMSKEVELDPQLSPEEIMSREVELDPQLSPEEIMSREVELG